MENNSAPEPERKKELKVYAFARNIAPVENIKKSRKICPKSRWKYQKFIFELIRQRNIFNRQKKNINPKLPDITYEKYISFEKNLDNITLEEEKMVIKVMINIIGVITEEIIFGLLMVKLCNQEEKEIIKESIKLLTEEKNSLKQEVTLLKMQWSKNQIRRKWKKSWGK